MRLIGYTLLLMLTACLERPHKTEEPFYFLERAFKESNSAMPQFFDEWTENSRELSNESTSELQRNFYSIYQEIFDPLVYKPYGYDNYILSKTSREKYLIIQPEIPYKIVDRVDTAISSYTFTDTLKHFYPKVHVANVAVLYLSEEYKDAFVKFLNSEENTVFVEKCKFLAGTLKIAHGYTWKVIETQPIVNGICISKDFSKAIVDTYALGGSERSYLAKENTKWTIKSTMITSIE